MKKCVVITTINEPTPTIHKHMDSDYDVIVVGDNKTPESYKSLNCIFLDISTQHKLFPKFSSLLPINHYCRKNIGYLYAIGKKYDIIYETDDDTEPYLCFDSVLKYNYTDYNVISSQQKWINFYKYFTSDFIWPRGYPLSLIKSNNDLKIKKNVKNIKPSIINGLIDNDPDVDSIYRLSYNKVPVFQNRDPVIVDNQNMCVFNTQNTFWINKDIFACLYIPCTVSFRYCDILRGIITNIVMKYKNLHLAYSSPNVVQYRNLHDLMKDFESEIPMFLGNETILNFIENNLKKSLSIKRLIHQIYLNLYKYEYVKKEEIDLLENYLVLI